MQDAPGTEEDDREAVSYDVESAPHIRSRHKARAFLWEAAVWVEARSGTELKNRKAGSQRLGDRHVEDPKLIAQQWLSERVAISGFPAVGGQAKINASYS